MRLAYITNIIAFICITAVASVDITVDTSQAADLANFGKKVKDTLTNWHSRVSNLLQSPNYTPPQSFRVTFDTKYDGVAYASGGNIVGSVKYYREHQDDVGSMVHEMAHIIQKYPSGCPGWLTEGIADWVRYYNYEPSRKPGKPGPNNHYTNGYGVTAYFLQYIIDVSNFSPNMVYWANKDCREGKYADTLWPRLTGKTLDQHWTEMMNKGKTG